MLKSSTLKCAVKKKSIILAARSPYLLASEGQRLFNVDVVLAPGNFTFLFVQKWFFDMQTT